MSAPRSARLGSATPVSRPARTRYPFASSIPSRYQDAKTILNGFESRHGRFGASSARRDYELGEPGRNSFVMKMTDNFKTRTQGQILEESIEVVASESTSWARASRTIERQGETASWCRFPGLSDPQRLINLIGKTAKMTFQLVDDTRGRRPGAARNCSHRRRAAADGAGQERPQAAANGLWSAAFLWLETG